MYFGQIHTCVYLVPNSKLQHQFLNKSTIHIMNMYVFSCLLEAVLQLTMKLSGLQVLRRLFGSIWRQYSEIDALKSTVYQHHWINQEVVLDMVFEENNAFQFWCYIWFIYNLLIQMGLTSCKKEGHKKTYHVYKMAAPCAKPGCKTQTHIFNWNQKWYFADLTDMLNGYSLFECIENTKADSL